MENYLLAVMYLPQGNRLQSTKLQYFKINVVVQPLWVVVISLIIFKIIFTKHTIKKRVLVDSPLLYTEPQKKRETSVAVKHILIQLCKR